MKRALSLTGVEPDPAPPVTPTYRSTDRSDLPARIQDAAARFMEVNVTRPRNVMLGRKELDELVDILRAETAFTVWEHGIPHGVSVAGFKVHPRATHESLMEFF